MFKIDFNESQIWLSEDQTSIYIDEGCLKGYVLNGIYNTYINTKACNQKYIKVLLEMKRNER